MTLNAGPVQRKGGGAKQFEVRCIVTSDMAPASSPQTAKPINSPVAPQANTPSTYL